MDNPANGDVEILIEQDFGSNDIVKNVFGYRDGISNPEIQGSGIQTPSNHDGDPIAAGGVCARLRRGRQGWLRLCRSLKS
ncbi:hypothetical protein [Psychrobacter sp. KH172YL61]|uniref:hypothetical protein n=1 Tax=Psychrobacter sp. KH172YL61 TaxID=2517899 RepID=UPI001F07F5DF|nr:hypothetical protein [Psychrobacter sp. KH172YL61]